MSLDEMIFRDQMKNTIKSRIDKYLLGENISSIRGNIFSIGDRKYEFINGSIIDFYYGLNDDKQQFVSCHKIEIFIVIMKINPLYNMENFGERLKEHLNLLEYYKIDKISKEE